LLFLGNDSGDRGSPEAVEEYPYKLRDDFLTPAERSFYGVISLAVGRKAIVCPKVGLRDVFFVSRPNENRAALNRIGQKHVDFLLCEPATMKPVLGIELDDSSHRRSDRKARDELVDRVFEAGDLPLLRVPAKASYDPQELRVRIQGCVDLDGKRERNARGVLPETSESGVASSKIVTEGDASGTPVCPKCGEPMVSRVYSRGGNRGRRFFGCPNYPKCRETLPVDRNSGGAS